MEKWEDYEANVIRLQKEMDDLQDDISKLKTDASGIKKDTSGLQIDVSGIKKDINFLKRQQGNCNINIYNTLKKIYIYRMIPDVIF